METHGNRLPKIQSSLVHQLILHLILVPCCEKSLSSNPALLFELCNHILGALLNSDILQAKELVSLGNIIIDLMHGFRRVVGCVSSRQGAIDIMCSVD